MSPRILVLAILGSLAWAQSGTYTVRGKVLSTSGQPLRKAEVLLSRVNQMMQETIAVTTGADGQFVYENLTAGEYYARVERPGFVFTKSVDRISLRAGTAPEPMELRMAPQAVLTGRITDEDGDPVADAYVEVTTAGDLEGVRGFAATRTGNANDLGEYRIAGLAPGRYAVSAGAPRSHLSGLIRNGPSVKLQTLYYPGVTEFTQARSIEAGAGAEIHDIDIQLKHVRAYHVRGKVLLPEADDPSPTRSRPNLMIHAKPDPKRRSVVSGGPSHSIAADGRFDIGEILPGAYKLEATSQIKGQFVRRTVSVDVQDKDVEDVVLSFLDGVKLDGEVRAEQPPANLKMSNVHVYLEPEGAFGANPQVSSEGKFELVDLAPGKYTVTAGVLETGGYVKSFLFNGAVVTNNDEVQPGGAAKLEIQLAFDTGEVAGVVRDEAGVAVPGASVSVYDDNQLACLCTHSVFADAQGRFQINGIQPGSHFIVAANPREVAPAKSEKGPRKERTKITVAPHSSQSLDVTVVR